jgi:hypothetical protein
MLADGTCIGLVPEEDARTIAQELERGGRVDAVVKKILDDGQFPVPVIGSRVHCIATDDVETVDVETDDVQVVGSVTTSRKRVAPRRRLTLTLPMAIALTGGVLLLWGLFAR